MQNRKSPYILAVKLVLAASLLLGLVGVAAMDLAPHVQVHMVLLYAVMGGLGLAGIVVAAVVVRLTVGQFVLRHGGTDAQWFWFRGEPQGLAQQRAQARALSARQDREPT